MESNQSTPQTYRERVLPSVGSLWSLILVPAASWLVFLPFTDKLGEFTGLGLGIFFAVAILVSIWFAAPVIEVDETGFSVSDAQLPLGVIGGYEIVTADQAFVERGRNLDPRAYFRFQLSVNTLIKLEVTDPQDSTPYWLIATRDPQRIAETLTALIQR